MDSKFVPPKNKQDFLERVEKIDLNGAMAVRNALLHRRASAVAALNTELAFYDAAIAVLKGEEVEWPPVKENK